MTRARLRAGLLGLLLPGLLAADGAPQGELFGAPLTLTETTPLAEIVADPDAFAGRRVLLRGRVAEVCQRKGCWTVLRDGDAHVRVRFADYAFFVPKDSGGAEAWAEGHVNVKTLSESQARHYAEETPGGEPESIVGPQREIGLVATGIRIASRREH